MAESASGGRGTGMASGDETEAASEGEGGLPIVKATSNDYAQNLTSCVQLSAWLLTTALFPGRECCERHVCVCSTCAHVARVICMRNCAQSKVGSSVLSQQPAAT